MIHHPTTSHQPTTLVFHRYAAICVIAAKVAVVLATRVEHTAPDLATGASIDIGGGDAGVGVSGVGSAVAGMGVVLIDSSPIPFRWQLRRLLCMQASVCARARTCTHALRTPYRQQRLVFPFPMQIIVPAQPSQPQTI
jgi:hypothetical protein